MIILLKFFTNKSTNALHEVVFVNYTVLPITNNYYKIMIVYYKSNVRMYRLAAYRHCICSMGCFQQAACILYQPGFFAGAEKGN